MLCLKSKKNTTRKMFIFNGVCFIKIGVKKSYGNLNIGILVQFLEERYCINVLLLGVKCGTKMLGFKWIFEHIRS